MTDTKLKPHPLKPCPYCSDPMMVTSSGMGVHVTQGDCIIGQLAVPDDPKQITKWNTRATPKVKALVWVSAKCGDDSDRETAGSMFGSYEVLTWAGGSCGGTYPLRGPDGEGEEFSGFTTIEEAKESVGVDYERRILIALED